VWFERCQLNQKLSKRTGGKNETGEKNWSTQISTGNSTKE
jgi:hypothetical protein